MYLYLRVIQINYLLSKKKNADRSVLPASQNSYPIYNQNLRFSLSYLWPGQKFDTLFVTWPLNLHPGSDLL